MMAMDRLMSQIMLFENARNLVTQANVDEVLRSSDPRDSYPLSPHTRYA